MDRPDLERKAATRIAPPARAHVVGDEGGGFSGVADWLESEGFEVSGRLGDIRADAAHTPASVPRSARLLVYETGVARESRERLIARRDGIVEASYPAVLGEVLGRGLGIAVAGRRQGRMAAAMIGWTLARAGLDPTVLLRSGVAPAGAAGRSGDGPHAVVDVTEALDDSLLGGQGPRIAVVLDVESMSACETDVLTRLAVGLGPDGYVLTRLGETPIEQARLTAGVCIESVSIDPGGAWRGTDLREDRGRFRFRAFHKGRFAAEIRLQAPGSANVLSALAALAVCTRIDVPARAVKEAIEDFRGLSRGFETRGGYRGATLIDDDSVEAADVTACFATARASFGLRRILTVFAPSRSPCLETAAALGGADRLFLWDRSVDADDWAGMLEAAGIAVLRVSSLDEALADLDRHLEPGDVLLTLGAGEVGTIADAFIRRLSRDRQDR